MPRYEDIQDFARNETLGANDYNRIRGNAEWLLAGFTNEHVLSTGEHNSQMIARSVGLVAWSGAAYSLVWSNSDVFLDADSHPATGTVRIKLLSGRAYDAKQMVVLAANGSGNGDNVPCLSTAKLYDVGVLDATYPVVEIDSRVWSGALGVPGGTWNAEDASQYVVVHSSPLPAFSTASLGDPAARTHGLRAGGIASYWNQLVQQLGDIRARFTGKHSAGQHNVDEIPKVFLRAQWNSVSGAYQIVSQWVSPSTHGLRVDRLERIGTGQITFRVRGPSQPTSRTLPIVGIDYARASGGTSSDLFVACAPQADLDTTAKAGHISIYKRSVAGAPLQEQWDRADSDFYLWLYGR